MFFKTISNMNSKSTFLRSWHMYFIPHFCLFIIDDALVRPWPKYCTSWIPCVWQLFGERKQSWNELLCIPTEHRWTACLRWTALDANAKSCKIQKDPSMNFHHHSSVSTTGSSRDTSTHLKLHNQCHRDSSHVRKMQSGTEACLRSSAIILASLPSDCQWVSLRGPSSYLSRKKRGWLWATVRKTKHSSEGSTSDFWPTSCTGWSWDSITFLWS